ncbi:glycosyltransferase [Patescibacteria group bacterium]|nr:glycosyltransferase [Patescibacteria group bacterium]
MSDPSHLSKFDVTQRQKATLQYVIAEEESVKKRGAVGPKVSIAEARQGATHYQAVSDRETTRLLFISQETSLLNQTTQSLDGYLNMSDVFDEVHILVIQVGKAIRNPVLRVTDNVWLYTVSAPAGLALMAAAKDMIKQQLEFADGFRADLIVARDPLLSGYLALWASRHYDRPAQLHMVEDFTQKKRFQKFSHPRLMSWLYSYVCKQFDSIRTNTDSLTQKLQAKYPHKTDIKTLPRFHNFASLAQGVATINIKDKYRQFSFIILYVGQLNFESKAYQAIDAARNLMRSPKVGLVILGDGDARAEFIKRAELLGIGSQVVFEKSAVDVYSYLKSADVLLVPDTDEESDELAIQAAAAGIPVVMAESPNRHDLFLADEAALYFNGNDINGMSNQMKKVLNDPGVRQDLVRHARDTVALKLHEDPLAYRLAYRDSIEAALFTE